MELISCFLGLQQELFSKYKTSNFSRRLWSSPIFYSENMIDPMMTSSNENIFRVTGPLCGEFTGPGEFPAQRPVTRSFDVFFEVGLNKRLSKQP